MLRLKSLIKKRNISLEGLINENTKKRIAPEVPYEIKIFKSQERKSP